MNLPYDNRMSFLWIFHEQPHALKNNFREVSQRDIVHIKDWNFTVGPDFICRHQTKISAEKKTFDDVVEDNLVGIIVNKSDDWDVEVFGGFVQQRH